MDLQIERTQEIYWKRNRQTQVLPADDEMPEAVRRGQADSTIEPEAIGKFLTTSRRYLA